MAGLWFMVIVLILNQNVFANVCENESIFPSCDACIRCGGEWCSQEENHCSFQKTDNFCGKTATEPLTRSIEAGRKGGIPGPPSVAKTFFVGQKNYVTFKYTSPESQRVTVKILNSTQHGVTTEESHVEIGYDSFEDPDNHINEEDQWTVDIGLTATSKFCTNSSTTQEFFYVQIKASEVNEEALFKIHVPCACECSRKVERISLMCHKRGDYSCGVCSCYKGWSGRSCENVVETKTKPSTTSTTTSPPLTSSKPLTTLTSPALTIPPKLLPITISSLSSTAPLHTIPSTYPTKPPTAYSATYTSTTSIPDYFTDLSTFPSRPSTFLTTTPSIPSTSSTSPTKMSTLPISSSTTPVLTSSSSTITIPPFTSTLPYSLHNYPSTTDPNLTTDLDTNLNTERTTILGSDSPVNTSTTDISNSDLPATSASLDPTNNLPNYTCPFASKSCNTNFIPSSGTSSFDFTDLTLEPTTEFTTYSISDLTELNTIEAKLITSPVTPYPMITSTFYSSTYFENADSTSTFTDSTTDFTNTASIGGTVKTGSTNTISTMDYTHLESTTDSDTYFSTSDLASSSILNSTPVSSSDTVSTQTSLPTSTSTSLTDIYYSTINSNTSIQVPSPNYTAPIYSPTTLSSTVLTTPTATNKTSSTNIDLTKTISSIISTTESFSNTFPSQTVQVTTDNEEQTSVQIPVFVPMNPVIIEFMSPKCNNNGDLVSGHCKCYNGWSGDNCSEKKCESSRGDVQCTHPFKNDVTCSGNGVCDEECQTCFCYHDRTGSQYFDRSNYCSDICMDTSGCDACLTSTSLGACDHPYTAECAHNITLIKYNETDAQELDRHNRAIWVSCNETFTLASNEPCHVRYVAKKTGDGLIAVMVLESCNTVATAERGAAIGAKAPLIVGILLALAAVAVVGGLALYKFMKADPPLPFTDPDYQNIDAEDCTGENPLYKPPTSNYKNPTYGKW